MKKPVEIRIPLQKNLQATLNAAGRAIRGVVKNYATRRAYGPRWEYDDAGNKVAVVYRVFTDGQDVDAVFRKSAEIVEEAAC